ncbi:MAG: methyltransferase domain-containing protein [Zetaproteobacteria bacterium]|nr:MAG: methyltransferase domain-containing protein [Zetaproteobacteria bacterium]
MREAAGSVRPRVVAARILQGVLQQHKKARQLFADQAPLLDARTRAWVHEAVYGGLRHFFSLEADFSRFLRDKPEPAVLSLLLLGTYQIRHMRTSSHAAVAETVEAAKHICPRATGLINAILRRVAASMPPSRLKPHQRLELPQWLYRHWRDAFGREIVCQFAPFFSQQPPLCLAVTTEPESYVAWLRQRGIRASVGQHAPSAILVHEAVDVASLPGYSKGQVMVMDQAGQMAVHALPESRSGIVLDLCAAPGGKGSLLAWRMPGAHIVSVELSSSRIPRLRENMRRMKQDNHGLVQADARNLPFTAGSVDRVLLDAPCSASGVLRRHPDAKFLHDPKELPVFRNIQRDMLLEGLRVLKAGGYLLYVVCSIHPEENEQVLEPYLEHVVEQRRILPSSSHDGFFYALLQV